MLAYKAKSTDKIIINNHYDCDANNDVMELDIID